MRIEPMEVEPPETRDMLLELRGLTSRPTRFNWTLTQMDESPDDQRQGSETPPR